jgi:hypothetical protein
MLTEMRRELQQYLLFMGIKKIFIVVAVSLLLQRCSCTKTGLDCAQTKYNFELNVRAYPDKDSIAVGDTVWLEVNSPTQFKDAATGQMIDYSKAVNLGSGVTFSALSSINQFTINSVNKFDFVLKEGIELRRGYNNGLGNEYQFIGKNNLYVFLLGIVAKEKGIYSIVFSNAANVYRSNDNCTKAGFNIVFANTNQHYPLNPFYIPGTNPRGGDYYFKVK